MKVRVSVIIPVYNASRYLRQCLESVVNQTLGEIEIICIDDGSTDNSLEILSGFEKEDNRVTVIRKENSGPAAARNAGLKIASGEYVQFLDSDDWFERDMLEEMYRKAQKLSSDVVICSSFWFDDESGKETIFSRMEEETFSPSAANSRIFQITSGQVWDKLFRRSFLDDNSLLFPPSLRSSEDVPFTYRAMLLASRISTLSRLFVHYRVNVEGSVSRSFLKYPGSAFDAFRMIYDFLFERGLMLFYAHSFYVWAGEYLSWHICASDTTEVRKHCYELYHREWKRKLGSGPRVIFNLNGLSRMRYLCVRYLPFCILNAVLLLYRKVKGKERE